MKVGDYVRTTNGVVKIKEIFSNAMSDEEDILHYGDFIKSSPNIIDLIEVGDYVNGMKIIDKSSQYYKLVTNLIDNNVKEGLKNVFINNEKDIKSIVTKEQFESMEYKVGE